MLEEKKRIEQKLKDSHETFKIVFDFANDGILVGDTATKKLVLANKTICDMLGYTEEELMSLSIQDIHPKKELPGILEIFEKQRLKKMQTVEDIPVKTKEGHILHVDINSSPIMLGGREYLLGIFRDITERKRSKKALYESNLRQKEAIRAANIGFWDWDLETDKVLYSAEWKRQIGYEEHEIGDEFEEWRGRVHPDDLKETLERVRRSITQSRNGFQVEFRFRHKNGSYRFILAQASIIKDRAGRPVRALGSHIDITDRKRAEEQVSLQKKIEREISELSALLLTTADLEEVSFQVLEKAKNITKSRDGFVGSVDPNSGRLIGHAVTGHGWSEWDFPAEPTVFEKRGGVNALLSAPAMIGDRIVGQITLADPEVPYSGADLGIVKRLATLYAMALQRHGYETALLEAEVQKAEELEKLVHERTSDLSESKELLEKIFTSQLDAIFVLGKTIPPLIRDCNPSAERLLGYRREEMIGQSTDFFQLDFEKLTTCQNRISAQTEADGFFHLKDFEMGRRDGSKFHAEISFALLVNEKNEHMGLIIVVHDISEHINYERSLRRSEENFRTIADFTYDWEDWRSPNGDYLYISPSCERITGYPCDAFLKNSTLTLDIVHPEDRERVARHMGSERERLPVQKIDFRIIHRKGHTRWISHYCQPVFNAKGEWLGRRGSNRDITERKQAEELLQKNRNMLQAVFDGISEPLVLMRGDGSASMMNKAAMEYYKISINDAVDGPCFSVFKKREQPCLDCPVLQAISAGEYISFERKGIFDPQLTEEVFVYPVRKTAGETGSAILRVRDMTVEKQMEQELIQADKMISLGILVSGVAHEINNPNNSITLNAPLLKDVWESVRPVLDEHYETHGDFLTAGLPYSEMRKEVPGLINGIQAGARRIERIVKDLKDYSRQDRQKFDESVCINDVVQKAVTLLQSLVKKSPQGFFVECGKDLPPIKGNSQKLEQVVINLIQNAFQALEDSSGSLVRVATAYDRAAGNITVTVEDEGTGIPEDVMPRIMDPFFTTKRDSGGTGLGLSVSSNIIKEHGGKIEVQSETERGSTFLIHLPVKEKKTLKRILVVDDDKAVRDMIVKTLSVKDTYAIQEVSNGTEAAIKLGIERPDLVILDLQMPDMNGVEICRLIKTNAALSGIKVMIITGFTESPGLQEVAALGFDSVVQKPFEIRTFQKKVDHALRES